MLRQRVLILAVAAAGALTLLSHRLLFPTAPSDAIANLHARLAEAEARARVAEAAAEALRARLPSASPRAAAFIHSTASLPAAAGGLMMMTYATGGVHEMLSNWVLHVQRLGLPELVAAMDADVLRQCTEQRFHCLDWSHTSTTGDKAYVRGSFGGFRALGVRKLDALLPVLRAGVHVVLSDVDCVWSSTPLPMFHGKVAGFEDFAHADVLLATDCMDPDKDMGGHGCFHDTVDKNTGVLAVRATEAGIRTMEEWRVRLFVGQNDEQDQTTFNDLLDGNGRGHRWGMTREQRAEFAHFAEEWCGARKTLRGFNREWAGAGHTAGSRRIFDVCLPNATKSALVGIFPISEVAGGHTFFIQQLHSPTAKWPMAVHATYQFGDMPDYPFGKRQRFRDWGMWLADAAEELAGETNYLVLEDDAPLEPRKPWTGGMSAEELHVRGRQHVDHLERTRQRLAYGFALGRAINRTVVLPTLWCYCDKFWHRLDRCAIPSAASSQPLPFVCPLDHVLDPALLHGTTAARARRPRGGMLAPRADGPWEEGIPFRGRYWLRQLGAHPRVGMSTATLSVAPPLVPGPANGSAPAVATPRHLFPINPQLLAMTATSPAQTDDVAISRLVHSFVPGADGPHLQLPPASSDAQLRRSLQQYAHVRLLRVSLSDARQLLGCYEKQSAARDMAELARHVFAHEWCYRPYQMTAEWTAVERRGKPRRGTEPWCVWGFSSPEVPPTCKS
ncbi:hypothetical protein AB1Y20_016951 [Prymnesium parvum]|uniref:Nucleotide-diphospho-sugar transferase domain-containing protein n=1 Tax=Prymnesium parvum TaxID=97485 RepID=A0AB34IDJ1_PRYPA